MNRPGLRTMLLGSRFTAPPIMAGCAYVAYQWWVDGGHGIIGLLAAALFIASAKALNTVLAYRRWRADWDAMSSDTPRKGAKPRPVLGLLGIAAVLTGYLWACYDDLPGQLQAWLAIGIAFCLASATALSVARLLRKAWPRRRQKDDPPTLVSVAVKRSAFAVPTVQACYQRLPDYCLRLLQSRT